MEEILIKLMQSATDMNSGDIATYASTAMLLIRFLRTEDIQEFLPKKLQWPQSKLAGKAIVLVTSVGITTIGGLIAGAAFPAALVAAIPVAISAIVGHKITQGVGGFVRAEATSAGRNIFQRLLDIVLPPPEKKTGA